MTFIGDDNEIYKNCFKVEVHAEGDAEVLVSRSFEIAEVTPKLHISTSRLSSQNVRKDYPEQGSTTPFWECWERT